MIGIHAVFETDEHQFPLHWRDGDLLLNKTVEAFLNKQKLGDGEIKVFKKYVKQWVNPPFYGPELEKMSDLIDQCETQGQISRFLEMLYLSWGINPL